MQSVNLHIRMAFAYSAIQGSATQLNNLFKSGFFSPRFGTKPTTAANDR